jgi:hypothetical protein
MDGDLAPWHNPVGAQVLVQALEERLGTWIEPTPADVRAQGDGVASLELEPPD